MSQSIAALRSRLDSLKEKRQEHLARKKVLEEERNKLTKKLKEMGFKNVKELKESIKTNREKAAQLEGEIAVKVTEIERALEEDDDVS